MEKKIQLTFEDKDYECKFEKNNEEYINIEIYQNILKRFEKKLILKEIYDQMPLFRDYTLEEIFSVINDLSKENFKLIKSSEKYYLEITIKVLIKVKHLNIELNEIKISKDEIIKKLCKKIKNDEKKISDLENEVKELKKKLKTKKAVGKEVNSKGKEKKIRFKITNIKNAKIIDEYNSEINSLLVLKDGRISVGHFHKEFNRKFRGFHFELILECSISKAQKTGINIYDGETYKEIMKLKGFGPHQLELRNGNLLVASEYYFSIIRLNETTYNILQIIKNKRKINSFEELSNGILSYAYGKNISFYKKENEKYSSKYKISFNGEVILNIQGKDNELIYSFKVKNEEKRNIYIFDYESKNNVKNIPINFEIDKVNKISKNLIAFLDNSRGKCKSRSILLFDFIKYQFIKSIEIFKPIDELDNIIVISLIYKNVLLIGYNIHLDKFLKQYKILQDDLILEDKREFDIPNNTIIKGLKKGRLLITNSFFGRVFVLSG